MDTFASISSRGGFSRCGMPWRFHLPWIIDSRQPVIFSAKLGLWPQIATQQLGFWLPHSHLQGTLPPKQRALLQWVG